MPDDRRRILVLIKGLGIGGAERLISEGARFWNREQFDYSVAYVLPWKDQLVGDLERLGIDVDLIGDPSGLTLRTARRLRRLIRSRRVDLIHAHLPTMGVMSRLISPVPVVYTEHNLTHSYRNSTRMASWLTYRRNAALIAVSDAVAGTVASWPGPSPVVIPNGVACSVSHEEADAARHELGLAPDAKLVAHVGNIRPGKGHDVLIDAVKDLAERRPDVTVVSIGVEKNAGDLERVRRRAEEAGLARQLHFLGRRADALAFVAAADVFVNPSEVEGLPVAVLEAMALERPVVATSAGGVPTIIREGQTGLLVEPGDPLSLTKGIERILDDEDMASRLAVAARELVEAEYGLAPMVESTEAVYRQVLGD